MLKGDLVQRGNYLGVKANLFESQVGTYLIVSWFLDYGIHPIIKFKPLHQGLTSVIQSAFDYIPFDDVAMSTSVRGALA